MFGQSLEIKNGRRAECDQDLVKLFVALLDDLGDVQERLGRARPELLVGAAFIGGVIAAAVLKRLV